MRRLYVMHRPERWPALEAALAQAGPEDAVLLLAEAVRCPAPPTATTYYAQEDAAAFSAGDREGVPVDADAIIRLLAEYDRVLSI